MVVGIVKEVTTSGVDVVDPSVTDVVNVVIVDIGEDKTVVGSARFPEVKATVDTRVTLGIGVPVLDVAMTIVDVPNIDDDVIGLTVDDTGAAISTELVDIIIDATEDVSTAIRVATVEVRISDIIGVGTTVVVATAGGVVVGIGTAKEYYILC